MATDGKSDEILLQGDSSTGTDFLPELQESDASPETRAIYDEIRRLKGAPMVALIWRHLATLPDVLPGAWSSIAPVLRSGMLQEAAWRLAGNLRLQPLPALTAADLKSMQVDADARAVIETVLRAYNRVNPVNMLCVYVLLARLLRPDGQALAPDVVLWEPPPPFGLLPRMYRPGEMPEAMRSRHEALSSPEARGEALTGSRTIPSLYRHFVPWPPFIEWIASALRPMIESGRMRQSVASIRAGMAREAEALVVHVPPALALQAHPQEIGRAHV